MNNELFQVIVQAVATLGVVAGLAYTALQLRGWREAQYVANFTKLVELQLELRKMMVDDPTMAFQCLGLSDKLSPDIIRGDYYNLMQLGVFEIAWFAHLHGQLTDDYFKSWVASMEDVARRPAFQVMWRSDEIKILHNGFREYMNQMVQRTASSAAGNDMRPQERN